METIQLSPFFSPLNSGKYRSWMLATTIFLCCTCIWPEAYSHMLNELGSMNESCSGSNYNGSIWER